MRVLILGGTVFLSAAIATECLARGHDVTCLSRATNATPPRGARDVRADRSHGTGAYDAVRGEWDAVVDVATDPRFVRDALAALSERARHWTCVSSCSVYLDQDRPGGDETRAIHESLPESETPTPENYGASKAACEAACHRARGDDVLVVRPGLIVGPGDPSDRGGYWPARFARDQGPVLVPEAKGLFAQLIDVSDVASWIVECGESGTTGTMNAVGEPRRLSDVLEDVGLAVGLGANLVRVDDQWLLDHGVAPWSGPDSLPLWIPQGQGFDGFTTRSRVLASAHGLGQRDVADTVRDILAYERIRGLERERVAGLSAGTETTLLSLWGGQT
ncbi:MAG TPA: NAD-dependent epimerase/dehydratase family protein [Acidimicrobiales bacterium]